jgi:cyanophycinase
MHRRTPTAHPGIDGPPDGPGTLVIIGGHEDKSGDRLVLRALAARAEGGALVVVTAASNLPAELWGDYEPLFRDLGVRDVRHLHVDTREEGLDPERLGPLEDAAVVFFTGGNQLKLTSQLGDTPIYRRVREIYEGGGCVAGTSAGASVVSETMMVTGNSTASPRVEDALRMAPGFGLIPGVIVDQHFAERGRIGRLIGAVAQNPRMLGVGIDEDTAIVCEGAPALHRARLGRRLRRRRQRRDAQQPRRRGARPHALRVRPRVHLLNTGDTFDLTERRPDVRVGDRGRGAAGRGAVVRPGAPRAGSYLG